MKIEIKISKKPVEYEKAVNLLEKRVLKMLESKKVRELIWILEHPSIYTGGVSSSNNEILDKSINVLKTNRGGKITYHGPGQIIFYIVINLNRRKKDIRWFLNIIEKSIIETLKEYGVNSKNDKKNIGIWVKHKNKLKKVAAIGLKIKRWIVYHGFSLNLSTDMRKYEKIIPCGIRDKGIINLVDLKKNNFSKLKNKLVKNFIKNLNY
tara:strand:- start:471 stop:1094 length:624 start_codon:yes stop_codon:yes gene_type:complete